MRGTRDRRWRALEGNQREVFILRFPRQHDRGDHASRNEHTEHESDNRSCHGPATILASPYFARFDPDLCNDCYTCTTRCQMEALEMGDDGLVLYEHRCIGCGLCVTTCTTGALTLARKLDEEQPVVPRDFADMQFRRGRRRGVLGAGKIVKTAVRTAVDHLRA